jgi:hypothetical protein
MCSVVGILPSLFTSVSAGTRHSIAHTIPHGATLTVEVPSNPDDVLPLFLVLVNWMIEARTVPLLSENIAMFQFLHQKKFKQFQWTSTYECTIEQNAPSGRITTLRPKRLDLKPRGPIVIGYRAFHEIAVRSVEPFHSNSRVNPRV